MTSSTGSRRPLPQSVYVRRRIAVGIVLVAIIAIVVAIFWPRGDAADPVVYQDPGAAATDVETPSPDAACAASKVQLLADTDSDTYAAGENVQISFTLTNIGTVPCTVDVGSDVTVYTVTSPSGSGDEVYWRSTDCQTDPTPYQIVLQPGIPVGPLPAGATADASLTYVPWIEWDRTRSSTGSCEETGQSRVGSRGSSFDLVVQVGSYTSEKTRFYLY